MPLLRNLLKKDTLEDFLFVTLCVVLALVLRLSLFPYETYDYHNFLSHWYDHLRQNGFQGFETGFSDYTPPYLYLLWLATHLPIPKLYAIKSISLLGDFALAFVSAAPGQAQIRPASRLARCLRGRSLCAKHLFQQRALGSVRLPFTRRFCSRRSTASSGDWAGRALLFFSIAFAFKLQAMFLLPVFFVLWAKGKLPLKYFLLLPAVYVALCLPAFLAGRPFYDLLTIYLEQANTYPRLTSSAPNLYQWLPDNAKVFGRAGLIFAVTLVGFLSYACLKK